MNASRYRKMQQAVAGEPTSVVPKPLGGDIRKFYQDYLNSDMYKKRLAMQGYPNPARTVADRQVSLATVGVTNVPNKGNLYRTSEHNINLDTVEQQKNKLNPTTTLAHEVSHALGSKGFKGMMESTINNSTLNTNELNAIAMATPNPKELHYNAGQEVKADIDAFRYKLFKDKIYDTKSRNFNKKDLDNVKKGYSKDPTFKRLFDNVKDADLIYLMNSIAQNNSGVVDNELNS